MVTLILIVLIVLGSVLIIGQHELVLTGFWEVVPHFGIAFLISGILGLTVEQFTKKKFTKEVADNVFKATIGHLLPEEFQDELRWIYGQKLICEQHLQNVRIKKLENSKVELLSNIERRIKNVSNDTQAINLGLAIDEWFEAAPSEIESFGYKIDDQERVDLGESELLHKEMSKGRPVVSIKHQNVKLKKGKIVTIWMTFKEIKPANSDHHSHFSYATKNPRVSIDVDNGITAVAAFPRETESNKVQFSHGVYQYNGLVLPAQEIRIRWWEDAKQNAWVSGKASSAQDDS